MGARPAIPAKRNEASVRCPDFIYIHRNRIERFWGRLNWGRLKEWRAVATRYEKTARYFSAVARSAMGVLCFAAARDWLKGAIKGKHLSYNRA